MSLPVFVFHDIFKEVIWGGDRIAAFKGLPPAGEKIGESWELSAVPGHESVVDGGEFDGLTLSELAGRLGADLLGSRVAKAFGGKFPLLIKFIDSADDLSVQVHPDDELAGHRHACPGKTEMWYSIDPAPGAYLYSGFNAPITREQFLEAVASGTLTDHMRRFNPKPGDVFFLPAGRVHSIGRGNFICEIQQASDITYRIYDYGRLQPDGTPRQLHLDESLDAIDFDDCSASATNVVPAPGERRTLHSCGYFTTSLLEVERPTVVEPTPGSFTVLIAVGGDATVSDSEGRVTPLPRGRTALVAASSGAVTVAPAGPAAKIVAVAI